MSILDDFDTLDKDVEKRLKVHIKKEEYFCKGFLGQGNVNVVIAREQPFRKLDGTWEVNLVTSFARQLYSVIQALGSDHQAQKTRPIYSVDCSKLCKGDAYGWLSKIAKAESGAIIVVENVTRVPSGDPNIYDDPVYVTNLLLRSWKNEVIHAGDVVIDRRKLTVILTCPPEDAEIMERECGFCSYAWFRDFNKYMDELHQMAEETVTLEA